MDTTGRREGKEDRPCGKSSQDFSTSLDGFIAGPNDTPAQPLGEGGERLFEWFFSGDIEFTMPSGGMMLKLSPESAEAIAEMFRGAGAIVSGRRMFDVANGWGGRHPIDLPVFVVTHSVPEDRIEQNKAAPFTFVTAGVKSAVEQAKQAAGNKIVGVGGANVAQQCLELGLLDEIYVQVVPVLLGGGVRLFDDLKTTPDLEPTRVIDAPGVTHLTYRVVMNAPARPRHQPFEAPAKPRGQD